MTLDHGLALWEHFNRSALQNMSGLSVFATNYETVLADPNGFESDGRRWLRQQFSDQQFLEPSASASHSSSTISPALRSQSHAPDSVRLPPSVLATFETLSGCLGAFPVFQPPPVAADRVWTVGVLDQKREAEDLPMVGELRQRHGCWPQITCFEIVVTLEQRTVDVMAVGHQERLTTAILHGSV